MKKTLFLVALLITSITVAQKRKDREGKITNLKDIKAYTIVFEYDDIKVAKFDTEEEFLKDKMDKREKKEAGKGEEFKKSWFADREERYEPKFIESFNKRFEEGEVVVGKALDEATHTMKIKTKWIHPGYNVGVSRKPALLNADIIIFETSNPDTVLFSTSYFKVQGNGAMGYDYNSGYRISEAYAKLAKSFAKYIRSKAR